MDYKGKRETTNASNDRGRYERRQTGRKTDSERERQEREAKRQGAEILTEFEVVDAIIRVATGRYLQDAHVGRLALGYPLWYTNNTPQMFIYSTYIIDYIINGGIAYITEYIINGSVEL